MFNVFEKDKVAPKRHYFGLLFIGFLLKYAVSKPGSFKGFVVNVLEFKIELFGYFFKKLGDFFCNHLVTLTFT
jgi:hypothetical protein